MDLQDSKTQGGTTIRVKKKENHLCKIIRHTSQWGTGSGTTAVSRVKGKIARGERSRSSPHATD